MKTIKINSLELSNFKGIQHLVTSFGDHTEIRGDNGTGKTTLFDAFLWLLFGKDSSGKSDFALKTLTEKNEEIPQIEHSVCGNLEVDGRNVALERTYREVWTKKKGSHSPSFTGHETAYTVDGVPVTATEYKNKIDGIIPEDTFRLLTSPAYFATLPWKKRRDLLMSVCGDISDEDVISGDKKLAKLPDILANRTIDDMKKVIAAAQAAVNKKLTELPIRIDEAKKTVTNTAAMLSEAELRGDIGNLEEELKQAEAADTAGMKAAEKKLRSERYIADKNYEISRLNQKKNDDIRAVTKEIESINIALSRDTRIKATLTANLERLAADYKEASVITPVDKNCPCCGQLLPQNQIADAKAKTNAARAEKMKKINEDGEATHKELEAINASISSSGAELEKLNARLAELKAVKDHTWDAESDYEYQKIISGDTGVDNSAAIAEIKEKLNSARAELAKIQGGRDAQARIEKLQDELKSCQKEYANLEDQLYLIEQFIVAKVNMLESRINAMFKMARFKLFEQQINGGISECCTILYNGVPYGLGLNKGAEINVGLDIIHTLSSHYGVKAPVWVDNAEAVVKLYELDMQTIRLLVDGKVKKLEVA